jgi:N-acylglucosamine-6-phosphate 2-epimerase
MSTHDPIAWLRGKLVVSCQALPDEPLHGAMHMVAMARAAVLGGAAGIRANSPEDIAAIRAVVDAPLIGLWKEGATSEVFITPTTRHALAVVEAGADIVAADATYRPRPDGDGFVRLVTAVHEAGRLVMADVATYEEGVAAADAGADIVGTTLSGFTTPPPMPEDPDLELVERLAARLTVPVIAEGRIRTPEQARAALRAGAWSVVVGGAITRPVEITRRFAEAL